MRGVGERRSLAASEVGDPGLGPLRRRLLTLPDASVPMALSPPLVVPTSAEPSSAARALLVSLLRGPLVGRPSLESRAAALLPAPLPR